MPIRKTSNIDVAVTLETYLGQFRHMFSKPRCLEGVLREWNVHRTCSKAAKGAFVRLVGTESPTRQYVCRNIYKPGIQVICTAKWVTMCYLPPVIIRIIP